jgi:transcriptional antiterminator RfaH
MVTTQQIVGQIVRIVSKDRGDRVTDTHRGWYLVLTKARHETVATLNLQRQGFHTYLPLFQEHKRRRNLYQIVTGPLFPRYLFICLNAQIHDWSKIRSTRGCISLVRFGALPARVPDALVERLQQDEATRLIQNDKECAPDFKPGDRVQVLGGVLANYEGIVEIKNSRERITLLLTIAEGHTRRVNLSVHQVKIAD